MGFNKISLFGALMCLGGLAAVDSRAQSNEFMPPDNPPPADWQVQGEYFGTVTGGGKLGAWVIGQGGDKYNVVFLPGGLLELQGDAACAGGWDKKTKVTGSGPAANITSTSGYKAAIAGSGDNATMTGTDNGGKAFTLKRVTRKSPTLGMKPPEGTTAEYWFRENTAADLTNWANRGQAPQLKFGGYLVRGVTCTKPHTTVFIHLEVRSAYCPTCRDQGRGNSGVYLRGMHEQQVLDSFGLTGADNELGAIYRVKPPLVNAALPPLTWQTYDIYYTPTGAQAATFTTYLNGVLVQDKSVVSGVTEAGFAGTSLYLQDHSNTVIYNNIWAVQNATEATFPYANLLPKTNTCNTLVNPQPARAGFGTFANPESPAYFDLLGRDLGVLDAAKLLNPHSSAPAGKDSR